MIGQRSVFAILVRISGDIPIAGDWNNDGCDTFGIYRNAKVFLRNSLDTGVADIEYFFGLKGDRPFAGDFDGVGGSTVGLYRQTSGLVYFRNSLTTGVADFEFFYGNPSDRIVPGDGIRTGTIPWGSTDPATRRSTCHWTMCKDRLT